MDVMAEWNSNQTKPRACESESNQEICITSHISRSLDMCPSSEVRFMNESFKTGLNDSLIKLIQFLTSTQCIYDVNTTKQIKN